MDKIRGLFPAVARKALSEVDPTETKAITSASSRNLIGVLTEAEYAIDSAYKGKGCTTQDALRRLNTASPHVYACLQRYLYALSPIRWEVKRRVKDNKFEPIENHDIEKLLAYPNMFMDGGSLNRRLTQHLLGCGNHYQRKFRGFKDRVVELFPLDPRLVRPIPHPTKFLSGYEIKAKTTDTRGVEVPFEDIIHYQLEDPENIYEGIGIVQANWKTIDSDSHAQDFWLNSIKRSIRKNGILSFKHDFAVEEAEEWEKKIKNEVMGSWNAGGVLLLGQEHTWTDLSKNTQDVDFSKARSALREYIAAIFSVPAPMVGILDNSTYNNIQMARMIFWLDTLLPFLELIRATMTRSFFFCELKGDERYEYIVDYDVSSVEALYYVFGQKLDLALKLFKMGIDTWEIIKALGINIPETACPKAGFLPTATSTVDDIMDPPDPVTGGAFGDNGATRNNQGALPPSKPAPRNDSRGTMSPTSERSLRLQSLD